ncbi:T9SS C-terminal target domain-containing protein, partial [Bacteroidetes/Chlorobi group bacterium ChocPot_Mid]
KVREAWEYATGDSNLIIGISDNGCYQHHEDLKNSIAKNWADPVNGIDDDGNGYIDDFSGYDLTGENQPPDNTYNTDDHGTNVAGIAAATVNNDIGMCGTAYKCRFFPIKIGRKGENTLSLPYESIIYAAKRGFKVLNCSWGVVKPFSDIDQSIVNYAVANDVAIVAAGGNDEGSLDNNYPSAYDGVLAVGEVHQDDSFSGNNIAGFLDILAPGAGNWYTNNTNGYANFGSGSSYSAPVVSGIVALVRAKYPSISNLQALELVRQSTDDVSKLNSNLLWKDILPGRVNALKAVTTEPFSIPSVRPKKVIFKTLQGIESSRFAVGDTVILSINAFNYLGHANNLKFTIKPVWDFNNSISMIDSVITIPSIEQNSVVKIEEFKFIIIKENTEKIFFRCDIAGENNYHDFFIIDYIPSPIITTFKNQLIAFSVSDRGTIGFGGSKDSKQGIGFTYGDYGNQIWKACFLAADSQDRFVSSLNWDKYSYDDNDFKTKKALVPPEINIGIFNDDYGYDNLGIEVKQEFIIPEGNYGIAKVNIEITNKSTSNILDFTSGYYFDWDIPDSDSNSVELLTNAIPNYVDEQHSAVELVYFANRSYPVFGNGVITRESNAIVQSSGNNRDIYIDSQRKLIMNSGTAIQDFGVFDAKTFSGVKFPGTFAPNEKKSYSICFGGANDKEEFITKMKSALDTNYTSVNEMDNPDYKIRIFPQPASNLLNCIIETNSQSLISITIVDLLGNLIFSETNSLHNSGSLFIPINTTSFPNGTYFLKAIINNKLKVFPIMIIK